MGLWWILPHEGPVADRWHDMLNACRSPELHGTMQIHAPPGLDVPAASQTQHRTLNLGR
jgi:hypothetical protein